MMFRRDDTGRLVYGPTVPFEVTPDVVSLATTVDATISSSTEITLDKRTTFVSVFAIAKDVYLKWGTADVTSSNMDEIILAGQVRNFLVPNGITALNVIEREASATVVVIEK